MPNWSNQHSRPSRYVAVIQHRQRQPSEHILSGCCQLVFIGCSQLKPRLSQQQQLWLCLCYHHLRSLYCQQHY
jgi:hypothetical protein